MKNDLLNLLLLALTFLLLFALSEFLYHQYKIKVELTRKLVHIGTGLVCLLFPILLKNHWSVLFLCGLFAVILLLSLKFNLLKSINAVDRKSVGSIVYPVAVYLCFLIQTSLDECYIYYYLPLVTLAICDPMAALSGKKWPLAQYKIFGAKKTLMGSTVFFICAMIVMFLTWRSVYNSNLDSEEFIVIATIALTATLAEAFSKDGYDNLTIPVSILVCLYIYFP